MNAFQKVWTGVKRFYGNPRLADPRVFTNKSEADKSMGASSLAYFDFSDKSINVHYPNLIQKLGKGLLAPIEMHEVGHHKFCPYDLKTLLRMINEADKILSNTHNAKYFENILSDTYVNTDIFRRGGKSIVSVYKAMGKDSKNQFWNVYMRSCERLWGLSEGTFSTNMSSEMQKDAKALEKLVNRTMHSIREWPDAMRRFTEIMKKYAKDTEKPKTKGLLDNHSARDFTDSRSLEKDVRGLAKELGFDQYKRVLSAAGAGSLPGTGTGAKKTACRMFYRDLARDYCIDIEQAISSRSESVPCNPVDWDAGDDVNQLDPEFSIRQMGRILPGESAFKWRSRQGSYGVPEKNYPDILIVLDSSISMPDPVARLSVPVLSSMILANTAFSVGSRVGVVNFSCDYSVLDYTGRQSEVEDELMKYLNGGTTIPGQAVLDIVESNENKQHIVIITDAHIGNIAAEADNLERAVKKAGAGGTIFLAGYSGNTGTSVLSRAGYSVKPAARQKDLTGLALKTAQEVYADVA